ncbi:hypothetical protein MMC28_000307 [Mycoblastus sanguinarius]|nr:hypothetical protein [Mycoblastus sanguinarius]
MAANPKVPAVEIPVRTSSVLAPTLVPERTSSLLAPDRLTQVTHLTKSINDLKRKASQLWDLSTQSRADFVESQLKLSETEFQLHTLVYRGLKDQFLKGKMDEEMIKKQARDQIAMRARSAVSMTSLRARKQEIVEEMKNIPDSLNERDRIEACQAAIVNSFRVVGGLPEQRKRNKKVHESWKAHLRIGSKVFKPGPTPTEGEKARTQWCPIVQEYGVERIAANVIPIHMGYENVAFVLGDLGSYPKGCDHIWSPFNGIVLSDYFGKAFDRGEFVIVPIETAAGVPQRLKMVFLKTDHLHNKVTEMPGKVLRELDGRELIFKGDHRPEPKKLYWHYMTSILRILINDMANIQDIQRRFPGDRIWASSRSYIHRSTLKHLATFIGDHEIQEGEFGEGVIDGVGSLSKEHEAMVAADIAYRLEKGDEVDGDEGASDEDSDELNEYEEEVYEEDVSE